MIYIEANKRFDKSNQTLNMGTDWNEMNWNRDRETEIEIEVTVDNEEYVPFCEKTKINIHLGWMLTVWVKWSKIEWYVQVVFCYYLIVVEWKVKYYISASIFEWLCDEVVSIDGHLVQSLYLRKHHSHQSKHTQTDTDTDITKMNISSIGHRSVDVYIPQVAHTKNEKHLFRWNVFMINYEVNIRYCTAVVAMPGILVTMEMFTFSNQIDFQNCTKNIGIEALIALTLSIFIFILSMLTPDTENGNKWENWL